MLQQQCYNEIEIVEEGLGYAGAKIRQADIKRAIIRATSLREWELVRELNQDLEVFNRRYGL